MSICVVCLRISFLLSNVRSQLWHALNMFPFLVIEHIILGGELLIAELACVGFLSSVSPQMMNQRVLLIQYLLTKLALEFILLLWVNARLLSLTLSFMDYFCYLFSIDLSLCIFNFLVMYGINMQPELPHVVSNVRALLTIEILL